MMRALVADEGLEVDAVVRKGQNRVNIPLTRVVSKVDNMLRYTID